MWHGKMHTKKKQKHLRRLFFRYKQHTYRNKVEKTTNSRRECSMPWRHQRASKQIKKKRTVNSKASTHQPALLGNSGEHLAGFSHSSSLASASPRSSSISLLSLTKCFALSSKPRSVWIGGSCSVLSFRFDCRWGSYCGRPTCPLSLHV